jgi:CheY-like chemotaxis protein
LVAEDDAEMRELIVQTLRKDGYAPQEARDGGRLLVNLTAQFQEGDVDLDLLISDIRMPVCTGLDILEAIRRARWTLPVILMTAFGDDETRRRAEKAGAVLLDKPFSLDVLRATVAKLMPLE